MHDFTPYSALVGGVLIGLSAVLLLLLNGRIAGISGILNGALFNTQQDRLWRLLFLVGLIIGGLLFRLWQPDFNPLRQNHPISLLVIGGFLVGFGARMANGCTSGHSICGLGNKSLRSLVATTVFIITGMITVYIIRHIFGMGL
jgi:uncharacterized protein